MDPSCNSWRASLFLRYDSLWGLHNRGWINGERAASCHGYRYDDIDNACQHWNQLCRSHNFINWQFDWSLEARLSLQYFQIAVAMRTYSNNHIGFPSGLKYRFCRQFLRSRRSQSTRNFDWNLTLFICSSSGLHRSYSWDYEWISNIEKAYTLVHSVSVLYHAANSIVLRYDQRIWSESFFHCSDLLSDNNYDRNAYHPIQARLETMCTGFWKEIR